MSELRANMSGLNNNEKLIVDFLLENQRIANKQL